MSHEVGETWNTTLNAQAATVDVGLLGQRSMQAHHVQEPVTAEIKELISSLVTPDGRCNYVSPAGEACLKTRHIEDRS